MAGTRRSRRVPATCAPHETCLKTHQQLLGDGSPDGRLEWPALLRKLDKLSPNYRS
jgi:hypothetical protein